MIRVSDESSVRVITLDRPERRNALTPAGLDELERAVRTADQPVLYLRGAGSAFCAGADLDVVSDLDRDEAAAFAAHGQRVATEIAEADGVVVAGIDGPARGGGVELALACDLRIATPTATFAEPGVRLGIFGAWGGTVRLPAVLGLGDALDLALSGRTVDAEEARRMGLVSRIADSPRDAAAEIATNDDDALRAIKERVRDSADPDVQEAREADVFGELVAKNAQDVSAHRKD